MIPVDVYLDATFADTSWLIAEDDDGYLSPVVIPVGIGMDVGILRWGEGKPEIVVSGDVAHTKMLYDTRLDWDPSRWMAQLDLGIRFRVLDTRRVDIAGDIGHGVRLAALAQPWWDDTVNLGIGAHLGVVARVDVGRVSPFVGVRADWAAVPGGADGAYDAYGEDITWTWTTWDDTVAGCYRGSVHVGVALR